MFLRNPKGWHVVAGNHLIPIGGGKDFRMVKADVSATRSVDVKRELARWKAALPSASTPTCRGNSGQEGPSLRPRRIHLHRCHRGRASPGIAVGRLDGATGIIVGTVAVITVAALWWGWLAKSEAWMLRGLLWAAGVWAAVTTILATDVGSSTSTRC